jgi:hypothetical protein
MTRRDSIVPDKIVAQTHNDLRALAGSTDISRASLQAMIDDIIFRACPNKEAYQDVEKMELLWRRLGWIAAFGLFIEPELRRDFQTMPLETEVVLDREPLYVISEPDRLLLERTTGNLVYQEYVLMPHNLSNRNWLQSWHYNMRLHVGMSALNETEKIKLSYAQVRGLSTGYMSLLDGRLRHPYVYGWYNEDTKQWSKNFGSDSKGWIQRPLWGYPEGVVRWVELCGKDTAEAQFPLSPNVYLDKDMLDLWTEARLYRERQIDTVIDGPEEDSHGKLLHVYFERRHAQCRPTYGPPCAFLRACWDPGTHADPLAGRHYALNPDPKTCSLEV